MVRWRGRQPRQGTMRDRHGADAISARSIQGLTRAPSSTACRTAFVMASCSGVSLASVRARAIASVSCIPTSYYGARMRTVAAAVTTVAAVIIVIAAGLLGWLIVLFVRTFSGVFLPLVVGGIAALVFRPYYDWLRGPGRIPVAGAVAVVFLSALVPLSAFTAFFGHLAVRQLLGLAEQAPEIWEQSRTLAEAMLPRVGVVLDTWGVGELLREIVSAQQTTVVEWLRAVGSQAVLAGFGFARGFSALLSWAITPIYFA